LVSGYIVSLNPPYDFVFDRPILPLLTVLAVTTGGLIPSLLKGQAVQPPPDSTAAKTHSATVRGTMETWHRVTLDFEGPATSEDAVPNPFSDYRLRVTFQQDGRRYVVPGFFAADGDAASSSATEGSTWRVRFAPDSPGQWTYTVSFRKGPDIATRLAPHAGSRTAFDGAQGTFTIAPTSKTGRDFRAKGLLQHAPGDRYLHHAGTKSVFIKGGANSPENLLAYADFDGTRDRGGLAVLPPDGLHHYEPHVKDWQEGDPTWQTGEGKGLIGALNYLSGKGMNSVYFLTMNWKGDGDDVWPWTTPERKDRFDVSKLAQWEIVFSHMDSVGIAPTMVMQETENDTLFDGGKLQRLRKLYYRELVARFGHHLGVTWNLGEETNHTPARLQKFGEYLQALDPYDHPIVLHNHVHLIPETLDPLLGKPVINGVSFQIANPRDVHRRVIQYLDASKAAGHPWLVNVDEIGHYTVGAAPDGPNSNRELLRREVLWGALMAGGPGVEWYFGYEYPHFDLDAEDWRSRDSLWTDTHHALEFVREYLPVQRMQHHDGLTWEAGDYVLADIGNTYAIYRPNGGAPDLELKDYPNGRFRVQWYNPNTGAFSMGSVEEVNGGSSTVPLGRPPNRPNEDWAILVRRID
jgi:hypothetical protein